MTEPPFHYPHDEGQPPPETHQQQTEQFEFPQQQQPSPPPFLQRHRVALLAGSVAFVLVVAGIVWALAASSGSADPAPPAPAPSSSSSAPAPQNQHAAKRPAMTRGTVTAENGATWTVKTDAGATVSVTVGGDTKFGTAKAPADKAKITVGSAVVITGQNKDGTVQARRIRLAEK